MIGKGFIARVGIFIFGVDLILVGIGARHTISYGIYNWLNHGPLSFHIAFLGLFTGCYISYKANWTAIKTPTWQWWGQGIAIFGLAFYSFADMIFDLWMLPYGENFSLGYLFGGLFVHFLLPLSHPTKKAEIVYKDGIEYTPIPQERGDF